MRKISLSKKDKRLNPKLQIVLIVLAVVMLVIGISVFVFLQNYHIFETKVVAPNCEADGYTESACVICKKIERTHYTKALGHNFGEIKKRYEPKQLEFGENYQACSRCKKEKTIKTEPTIDFKKLYFTGDAFTVDSNRIASGVMDYSYKGKKSTYYVSLAYVDDDNSRYIKHDYVVSFFADKKKEKPVKVALLTGQPAAQTWYLYGNFGDYKNVRDIVVSELFCDARNSGKTLVDERLKGNFLTARQEPIIFFMNTTFVGSFRVLQLESANTLNVKETAKNCAIVRASYSTGQSFFKTKITPSGAWKVKYNSNGEDNEWIYDSLNELAAFVSEKEGEEFKKGLSKYLDVDAMIDYILVVYNTCAADNVGRALTLGTYDGKVWIPTFFDADASFGLNNKAEISLLETVLLPEHKENDGEMIVKPDTNSLLIDKMFNYFYDEIKQRYNELKNTVFATKNIKAKFNKHINKVPKLVFEKEAQKYNVIDTTTDMTKFLDEFMASRKNILEEFFKTEKQANIKQTQTTKKETTN